MDQLAPQALGALLRTHALLQQQADALSGGPLLARAYRAWAALARLRRQVELLGCHLQQWRAQQLQQERWLAEAHRVLAITSEEPPAAEASPPRLAAWTEDGPMQHLVGMGFAADAAAAALRQADGTIEGAIALLVPPPKPPTSQALALPAMDGEASPVPVSRRATSKKAKSNQYIDMDLELDEDDFPWG